MWEPSSFFLLYYVLLLAPLRHVFAEQMFGKNTSHLGPYSLLACEEPQAQALTKVFAATENALVNQIIPHSRFSPLPNPLQDPFHIFFSSNTRSSVAQVYHAMIDAPTPPVRPTFICINPAGAPELENARGACTSHDANAFSIRGANGLGENIFLCPSFFEKPAFPTAANCPKAQFWWKRYFSSNGHALGNQFSILVYELAHHYAPHPIVGLQEIHDLNKIIYQNASFQLNNAANFAYFAACKPMFPSMNLQAFSKSNNRHLFGLSKVPFCSKFGWWLATSNRTRYRCANIHHRPTGQSIHQPPHCPR